MPEPGMGGNNDHDVGGQRDGGTGGGTGRAGGVGTPGVGGGFAPGDYDAGFSRDGGRSNIEQALDWAKKAGRFSPIAGLLGGIAGYAMHPDTPKTMSEPGAGGYDTRDGGTWPRPLSSSFDEWMDRGGFGSEQAPLGSGSNDFFGQARFNGTVPTPAVATNPSEGVTGLLDRASGMFGRRRGQRPSQAPAAAPAAPYYTPGATVPGTSPEYARMYGIGSPFMGPQDIFGG
jgi:hypothetical protein